jgi:hypothetical protein
MTQQYNTKRVGVNVLKDLLELHGQHSGCSLSQLINDLLKQHFETLLGEQKDTENDLPKQKQ